MAVAQHLCLRLVNDAAIAASPAERRTLAGVVLERARKASLIALRDLRPPSAHPRRRRAEADAQGMAPSSARAATVPRVTSVWNFRSSVERASLGVW